MTIKEFFSLNKNRFFWINLPAMIVVAGLLVFITMEALASYTRHGQAILVPDAKGLNILQAEKLFRGTRLRCVVSDSVYIKDKPAGCVIDHIPAAGRKVKDGRTIYLTINTLNVPLQLVPDVADNSSLRQAKARISASGFKLTDNELIRGEKDWVYEIKYNGRTLEPGDKAPVGSTLTLVVGDGFGEDILENDSTIQAPNDSATDGSWF